MRALNNIFEFLLEIFLPKEEKTIALENISEEHLLSLEKANEIHVPKLKSIFNYKDKIIKRAIWEIKYNRNDKILKTFSKILYEFIFEAFADEIAFSNFKDPIIVPIPSSRSKKEKGFNQAELIAKEIFRIDNGKNFKIRIDFLSKIKETQNQSKIKNRTDRLKNLINAFSASTEADGENIILIDDVITTGATMKEATRALKEAGAKNVLGFSIAH
jgi:competence protein ComFC